MSCGGGVGQLTIAAGLNRSFNVTNAFDSHAILVVTIDELVLELSDLVDQHTELVRDVRDVVITSLAPDGKLLLCQTVNHDSRPMWHIQSRLTATSIRSLLTSSILRMTFFSILTSCDSFFARSGP